MNLRGENKLKEVEKSCCKGVNLGIKREQGVVKKTGGEGKREQWWFDFYKSRQS